MAKETKSTKTDGADKAADDKAADVKPLEIPAPVDGEDFVFENLEDDGVAQLLDQMFEPDFDVDALRDDIVAEIMQLNEDRSPENVKRMTRLGEYLSVVEAEQSRRAEAQQELDGAADAIVGRFQGDGEDDDEEDDDEMVGAADGEGGDGDEGDGGSGDGADDGDDDEKGDGEDEGGDKPAAEREAAAKVGKPSGSGLARSLAHDASAERGSARVKSATATVVEESTAKPDDPAALAVDLLGFGDSAVAPLYATKDAQITRAGMSVSEGEELSTLEKLGEAFWMKHQTIKNRQQGVRDDRISLAQAVIEFSPQRYLTQDAVSNFGLFSALRQDVETIVASGGSCAPAAPRYDIFRLATPQSPVEDNLPVLGAPRGAIRFVVPPDFRDVRAGVGVTTDAEDAAGYGSGSGQATPKPCVHAACPDIAESVVTAVSTCIEFGNLTFETFPEFVAARVADLAVNFASVKEVFYLNGIDTSSTTQTYVAQYGISRSLPRHVATSAHNYRKRNNMDLDARLDWYGPDWVAVAHQIDKRNDQGDGVNQMPSIADVTGEYAQFGLNVVWYYDSASGTGQAFTDLAQDGPGNDFPTEAVWYLHAPGTFVRLDAGTLDLGIVRDSALNRTNDLQIFAEQWIQITMLGLESIRGVSQNLCPSGGAPAPAELLTCASGS